MHEQTRGTIEHAHDVTIRYTNRAGQRYELTPQGEIQLRMVQPLPDYEDQVHRLVLDSWITRPPPHEHLETSPLKQYTVRLLPETWYSKLRRLRLERMRT